MRKRQTKRQLSRIKSHPTLIPISDLLAEATLAIQSGQGRFAPNEAIKVVYRAHQVLLQNRTRRKAARLLAETLNIVRRKNTGLMRVLVEAVFPEADPKQKSRWSRALDYIAHESVPPERFLKFVSANGGLAGCARLASRYCRKKLKGSGQGHWDDDAFPRLN